MSESVCGAISAPSAWACVPAAMPARSNSAFGLRPVAGGLASSPSRAKRRRMSRAMSDNAHKGW